MKYFLFIALLCVPLKIFAESYTVINTGYAIGVAGTPIVDFDHDEYHTDSPFDVIFYNDLYAGTGVFGEVGYHQDLTKSTGIRLLIGYKSKTHKTTSASHSVSAFPASVLFNYTISRFSFGGGMTYVLNPVYKAVGRVSSAYNDTAKFDNAIGYSTFLNVRLTRSELISIGVRFTAVNYSGASTPISTPVSPGSDPSDNFVRKKTSYNASNLSVFGILKF